MLHMRFLPPSDQKCAESLMYSQFFYYRPSGKFQFTQLGEIVKMFCQELYIYMTLLIIDMDFLYQFNMGLIAPLFTVTFHEKFEIFFFFNFQKLAGLWLVGEVDNHVAIYGSKLAEGFFGVPTSVLLSNGTSPLAEFMLTYIKGVLWHSLESSFTRPAHELGLYHVFWDCSFEITNTSPRAHSNNCITAGTVPLPGYLPPGLGATNAILG